MKKPTLEEVKEYFKNVKEVIPVGDTKKVNITKKIKEDIHEWNGYFWIDLDYSVYKGISVLLWDADSYEYAKILTYKEKTFSITESQIKEYSKEREHCLNTQHVLRKLFPEAFESEVKLKRGMWLTRDTLENKWIVYVSSNNEIYGIDRKGEWFNSSRNDNTIYAMLRNKINRKATEQEVFEALKNEAVKRGFVGNQYVDITPLGFFNEELITGGQIEWKEGYLNFGDKQTAIFKNGVWGKVLD